MEGSKRGNKDIKINLSVKNITDDTCTYRYVCSTKGRSSVSNSIKAYNLLGHAGFEFKHVPVYFYSLDVKL